MKSIWRWQKQAKELHSKGNVVCRLISFITVCVLTFNCITSNIVYAEETPVISTVAQAILPLTQEDTQSAQIEYFYTYGGAYPEIYFFTEWTEVAHLSINGLNLYDGELRTLGEVWARGGVYTGGYFVGNGAIIDGPVRIRNVDSSGGASGSFHYGANDMLEFDSHTDAVVQFLSPNDKSQTFYFGDVDDPHAGYMVYDHVTDTLDFGFNDASVLSLSNKGATNSNPYFHVSLSAPIEDVIGGNEFYFVKFDSEEDNEQGHFDIEDGAFISPKDGKYFLTAGTTLNDIRSENTDCLLAIYADEHLYYGERENAFANKNIYGSLTRSMSVYVKMKKGSKAMVLEYCIGSKTVDLIGGKYDTWFTGGLIN